MNDVMQDRAQRVRAMDLARRLRAATGGRDLWVSTEAAVRVGGQLFRPPVLVAKGHPPYDGILLTPPLLVVELRGHDANRWESLASTTVWAPDEPTGSAVVVHKGRRRSVKPGADLSVPRYPYLRLKADLVCGGAPAPVVDLAG